MPVATETGGGELKLPKAGMHPARSIHVIDLGTQRDTYMGKPKIIRKVRFGWELPNHKAIFDEAKGEEPFIVGADYTLSLNEKANLRHMLESWRGREFTAKELKGFELATVIGKACMVNIIHRVSKTSKKEYAVVASVTPVPEGMTVPKATLERINYDIEMGNNDVFKKIPEWIQKKILASVEASGTQEAPAGESTPEGQPEDADEIPL
jgi:hypothetical protein